MGAADSTAEAASDTARDARQLFQQKCVTCHHDGKKPAGGLHIMDAEALKSSGWIDTDDPSASELFNKLDPKESGLSVMPPSPGERVSPSQENIILRWIQEGAPDLTPEEIALKPWSHWFAKAKQHLDANPESAEHTRFLYMPDQLESDQLEQLPRIAHYVLAHLSRLDRPQKEQPMSVEGEDRLVAFDLRNYGLSERDWQVLVHLASLRPSVRTHAFEEVAHKTGTRQPMMLLSELITRGFFHPGYPVIKRHPTNLREWKAQLGVSQHEAEGRGALRNFTTTTSGVSGFMRTLHRFDHPSNPRKVFWESDDFKDNVGRSNPIANPFGAAKYRDGSEVVWFDGIPEFGLFDGKDNIIAEGPFQVVQDFAEPDFKVKLGKSCASCHLNGVRFTKDHLREHALKFPRAYGHQLQRILRLHPDAEETQNILDADMKLFHDAMIANQVDPLAPQMIQQIVESEAGGFTIERVSLMLGVSEEQIMAALDSDSVLALNIGIMRTEAVDAENFKEFAPRLCRALGLNNAPTRNPMLLAGNEALHDRHFDVAHIRYQWAQLLDPDNADIQAAISRFEPWATQQNATRAIRNADTPEERSAFFYTRALAKFRSKDLNGALVDANAAVAADHTNTRAAMLAGNIREALKQQWSPKPQSGWQGKPNGWQSKQRGWNALPKGWTGQKKPWSPPASSPNSGQQWNHQTQQPAWRRKGQH